MKPLGKFRARDYCAYCEARTADGKAHRDFCPQAERFARNVLIVGKHVVYEIASGKLVS